MAPAFDFGQINPKPAPNPLRSKISVSSPSTLHSWKDPRVRIPTCGCRCVRTQADDAGRIGVAAEIASVKQIRVAQAWDPVARWSRCSRWLETCDSSGRVWVIGIWCCATDHRRPGGVVAVVWFRVRSHFPDFVELFESDIGR